MHGMAGERGDFFLPGIYAGLREVLQMRRIENAPGCVVPHLSGSCSLPAPCTIVWSLLVAACWTYADTQ